MPITLLLTLLAFSTLMPGTFLWADEIKSGSNPKPPSFGLNPSGIDLAPEVQAALHTLNEAGRFEGRRGSLTFFRWADSKSPRLAHLGLWGPKIGNAELALTRLLPDLEFVSLYETSIDDAGLAALERLPRLRSFAVLPVERYEKTGFGPPQWSYPFLETRAERPRITAAGLRTLTRIATLESLDLLDARLTSSDLEVLASWPRLGRLSLPCAIDAEAVKSLQACRKLSHLTLGGREIAADEVMLLARWKSLRKLTLTHARLTDDTLRALSQLDTVPTIELLDCGLTDEQLRHLHGSPALTELILSRNEIDGPGLSHLARLNLKSLGLEFNNLRDETLRHLPQLTSLEELGLSYCLGITNEGLRGGELQRMTHLKELRLRGLKLINDAALDELSKFRHLAHINIRETQITPIGVDRLRQALPNTIVFK